LRIPRVGHSETWGEIQSREFSDLVVALKIH
jgi:hypothetical protein